jgi:hypothetical protein
MFKRIVQKNMLLAGITLVSLSHPEGSQTLWAGTKSDIQKWETEIAAFEAADKTNSPPNDAILFVGSSSIRLWQSLAHDFPEHKVIIVDSADRTWPIVPCLSTVS